MFGLDISKQFISCVAVHAVNLRLSISVAGFAEDPCRLYLAALLVDLTAGLVASWFMLRLLDICFQKAGLDVDTFHAGAR